MKHGQKAFTPDQAAAIRTEYQAGTMTRLQLAQLYDVGTSTIDRLVNGRTYQNVHPAAAGPPTRLKRHRLIDSPKTNRNTRTRTLLRTLGIPAAALAPAHADFWEFHAMTLEHLATKAKNTFRRRMKSLHPDVNGNAAEASRLNQLWQTLKHRFRRRGINP